jgi:hypothetical protein
VRKLLGYVCGKEASAIQGDGRAKEMNRNLNDTVFLPSQSFTSFCYFKPVAVLVAGIN